MLLLCLYLFLILTLVYFVYFKIVLTYLIYFHYKRQGMACVGVPLPIIGNLLRLLKLSKRQHEFKWPYILEFWNESFKEQKSLPSMVLGFQSPNGQLMINDPEVLNEIYLSKSQFVDKSDKFMRVLKRLTGNSMLFQKTDDLWALKRKHLSASFYKDKLN